MSTATGGADLTSSAGTSIRPTRRLRAEHREEVRRHQPADGAVRLAAPEHAEREVAELDELVDRLRPSAIVGHLGKRERRIVDPGGDLRLSQGHDAVGFGIRKRAQEHAVDDAENRGVRADAESEREHERDGKSRHAGQIPERDADVVDHLVLSLLDIIEFAEGSNRARSERAVTPVTH